VTLVDTKGEGPERVTGNAVVVAGREYEIDCLILATGFDTGRGLLKSWGVDLVGVAGIRLTDYWKEGMRSYQGMLTRNFPNCFSHSTTQNAGPPNYTSSALEISEHIAYIVAQARARGARRVETSFEAEEAWTQMINSAVPETHLEFFRSCTPGFYNNYGNLDNVNRLGANNFLGGSVLFYDMLRSWRAAEQLQDLELR